MLGGLVTIVTAIFFAVLQGAFFIAGLLVFISGVNCFGSYYVSRYAELKEMEEQLLSLKATNKLLIGNADDLKATNTSLSETAQKLSSSLDSLSTSEPKLAQALDQLLRITPVLEANEKRVQTLLLQEAELKGTLNMETDRLKRVHQDIQSEVTQLTAIRASIATEVFNLKEITSRLSAPRNVSRNLLNLFSHYTIAENDRSGR